MTFSKKFVTFALRGTDIHKGLQSRSKLYYIAKKTKKDRISTVNEMLVKLLASKIFGRKLIPINHHKRLILLIVSNLF